MLTVVVGVVTFSVTGVMNTCHHSSCTSGTGRPNFTALFVCCRWHTALQISLTVDGYCSVSTHRNPTRRCTGRRTDCRCHCIDKGHCPGVKSLCMSPYLGPATPPGPEVASCLLAMSTLNFVVHVYKLPCQHNQSVDHSVDILCEFLTL